MAPGFYPQREAMIQGRENAHPEYPMESLIAPEREITGTRFFPQRSFKEQVRRRDP